MSKVLVNESSLVNIADAIREKNGSSDTYKPADMGEAILAIESGSGGGSGLTLLHEAEITEPVHTISVDVKENWLDYDYIYITPEKVIMSETEWLCCGANGFSGLGYIGTTGSIGRLEYDIEQSCFVLSRKNGRWYSATALSIMPKEIVDLKTVGFSTYYQRNTMNSGKIKIYGGKF